MRISDWSSDVCSSDLVHAPAPAMGKAAKAHQRCDIHIPVNIGSLGEQPDHSRPLPPVKHGEGATPQLYLPAIGGPQPGKAGKQTAFPCAICSQDHCNLPLTKGAANAIQNLAAAQIEA